MQALGRRVSPSPSNPIMTGSVYKSTDSYLREACRAPEASMLVSPTHPPLPKKPYYFKPSRIFFAGVK
jgi:hypothetical protein